MNWGWVLMSWVSNWLRDLDNCSIFHIVMTFLYLSFSLFSFSILLISFYSLQDFMKSSWNLLLESHEIEREKESKDRKCCKTHKRLNPSWKICSSAVDGQSFFVIDGSLLTSLSFSWILMVFYLSSFIFFMNLINNSQRR